jgi:TolB-like protein
MFRSIVITAVLHAVLLSQAAGAETANRRIKVAVLPMKSATTPCIPALLDSDLSTALLTELARTSEFQFVESTRIQETLEDQWIDDAVFELLVTQDLKQSLATLDTLSTESGRCRLYAQTASRLGIDYLIEPSCRADRLHVEITYRLIDTGTGLSVFARTLTGSGSGLANETAKRVTRDLWWVLHRE